MWGWTTYFFFGLFFLFLGAMSKKFRNPVWFPQDAQIWSACLAPDQVCMVYERAPCVFAYTRILLIDATSILEFYNGNLYFVQDTSCAFLGCWCLSFLAPTPFESRPSRRSSPIFRRAGQQGRRRRSWIDGGSSSSTAIRGKSDLYRLACQIYTQSPNHFSDLISIWSFFSPPVHLSPTKRPSNLHGFKAPRSATPLPHRPAPLLLLRREGERGRFEDMGGVADFENQQREISRLLDIIAGFFALPLSL